MSSRHASARSPGIRATRVSVLIWSPSSDLASGRVNSKSHLSLVRPRNGAPFQWLRIAKTFLRAHTAVVFDSCCEMQQRISHPGCALLLVAYIFVIAHIEIMPSTNVEIEDTTEVEHRVPAREEMTARRNRQSRRNFGEKAPASHWACRNESEKIASRS